MGREGVGREGQGGQNERAHLQLQPGSEGTAARPASDRQQGSGARQRGSREEGQASVCQRCWLCPQPPEGCRSVE